MNRESPSPERTEDQALAATLRETLDRAASGHDPLLDAALAATRAQAMSETRRARSRWMQAWLFAGGIAVAASVAVVMVLPGLRGPVSSSVSVVNLAAAPPVDPQMLEDMDLLLALDEDPNGG
ncbi:MAG: hypothetical protein ACLGHE_10310 [Gammaproteobacteria bacterium]